MRVSTIAPVRWAFLLMTACATTSPIATADAPTAAHAAGDASGVRAKVRAYRRAHEHEILGDFVELLSIPNVASDRANIRRNAEKIVQMLAARGVAARLLEAPDSPPAVYAEIPGPPGAKTLIAYAHYDGQPVDPAEWKGGPFTPVLRDGPLRDASVDLALPAAGKNADPDARLFARSASDDKAGVMGLITALDALKASHVAPSVRVKLFFEGEEEAGSPHLAAMLRAHADELKADGLVFIDGPAYPNGSPLTTFGVRGVLSLELTAYGANRTLHSGHYGNWAPNPAVLITHLLDSMRDANGTILVPGLLDHVRPVSESERAALARVPDVDATLKQNLALAWTEGAGEPLVARLLAPALNVRGIQTGHVGGKAANAIPSEARASIDFRLVPDMTPDEVRARVEAHMRAQGFYVVHAEPDRETRLAHPRILRVEWGDGYPATRTPLDAPLSRAFLGTLDAVGAGAVVEPAAGASLPTHWFEEILHVPLVFLSTANYDNNQHAANENIRLQSFWDGIELEAALLANIGQRWK